MDEELAVMVRLVEVAQFQTVPLPEAEMLDAPIVIVRVPEPEDKNLLILMVLPPVSSVPVVKVTFPVTVVVPPRLKTADVEVVLISSEAKVLASVIEQVPVPEVVNKTAP
jgi:hypothetical protein